MLVIPAIDIKQGKCVRLKQGLIDQATVFSDNPLDVAERWESEGARRLHIVDLDGAFAGKPVNYSLVESICKRCPEVPIQIGGGIREHATIDAYLNAGAQYVIIGTKALTDPDFVKEACEKFPGQITVGLDAKNGKVATEGWAKDSDVNVIDQAVLFEEVGVSAIIYTDIGLDGMMQGPNIASTQALAEQVSIPIIASGGISQIEDIRQLCGIASSGVVGERFMKAR